MTDDDRGGVPVSRAEAERQMLRELTVLAKRDPTRWYATATGNDRLCYYCGLNARRPNLCEPCEGLRQRLLEKYPEEVRPRPSSERVPLPRLDTPDRREMTPLKSVPIRDFKVLQGGGE